MSSWKSIVSRGTAAALAAGAATLGGVALSPAPAHAASSGPYLFSAFAYGTMVSGGSLPASSGKSAYAAIGCTNRAGRTSTDGLAGIDLAGLRLGAVTNVSKSIRSNGAHISSAQSTIASVVAGEPTGPTLRITALRAQSRSWHDSRGFHSSLTYTGALAFTPVAGLPSIPIAMPAQGRTVRLPGLGTLTGGSKQITRGAGFASASGYALSLHLDASDSTVRIGRTNTTIRTGTITGVLSGRSFGSTVDAVSGALTSGPTALKILPCQGTGGRIRTNDTARVVVPGVLDLGATESLVRGSAGRRGVGDAWTRSTVARAEIGGGVAVIRGIRASAHVHRTARGRLSMDARGTGAGTITVNGRTTTLPVQGRLEVPRVARIDTRVVRRSANSISVVAARVTLLSGTGLGSVIDLGNARASITRH